MGENRERGTVRRINGKTAGRKMLSSHWRKARESGIALPLDRPYQEFPVVTWRTSLVRAKRKAEAVLGSDRAE
jgi:hypothetical protein